MKIAISTQWNGEFKEIAGITLPVMQEFCLRHGYSLLSNRSDKVSPEIIWERISDTIALLEMGFDAVVHMDADCLITNLTGKIELLLDKRVDGVFTAENGIINDGVCIWMQPSIPKLNQILRCADQASSPQDVLNRGLVDIDALYLPPRSMNSVLNAEYGAVNPLTEWQYSDFVLHLPGVGNARRVELFKEYSQKIIR